MPDAPHASSYTVVVAAQLPAALAESMARLDQQSVDELGLTDATLREFGDRFCSEADISGDVVAVHDDAVIGMVLVYRRALPRAGQPVVLGGIGSVYVAPAQRGRGIARRLVQTAMSELARAGCDLAFLCADLQNPQLLRLYGGVGFVALGRPYTYAGASGARYSGEDGMLAPVCSPAIFAELLHQAEPLEIGRGNW